MERIFQPARMLLPQGCDMTRWSVVACDQYTAQPEYWEEVQRLVGDAPSTLRLILPELQLEQPGVEERIAAIAAAGRDYLARGVLARQPEGFIYLERTLADGQLRRGLVGKLDLLAYDYAPGSAPLVRATEGTVLERIPPRMEVRRGAPVESPHIMLLADDPQNLLLGPLAGEEGLPVLYDFALMQHSGAVKGRLVAGAACRRLEQRLDAFAQGRALVFAVGDGNHSLATAKACYQQLREQLPQQQWLAHPARYALVELVNLHEPSLQFEAIHRVVFGIDPARLLRELEAAGARPVDPATPAAGGMPIVTTVDASGASTWALQGPPDSLAVGLLQPFLDGYLARCGGRVDYIHGAQVARRLGAAPGNLAFLLPQMEKSALFPAVAAGGPLPRKTFSMGAAQDKRFYLECRRILP